MARRQSVPSPIRSPQASQRPPTSWKRRCFVASENDRAAVRRNGFGPPARLRSCFIGGDLSTFSAADPEGTDRSIQSFTATLRVTENFQSRAIAQEERY